MTRNIDRWVRGMRDDLATLEVPQDVADRFGGFRDDPIGFARDVLGVKQILPYQRDFMRSVARNERTAWVAGHATGKSFAVAVMLAWYLLTRPGCRCIVTSATFERQVGRVVFTKLRALVAKAKDSLPITVQSTRAMVAHHPEWGAEGVPATPGTRCGGLGRRRERDCRSRTLPRLVAGKTRRHCSSATSTAIRRCWKRWSTVEGDCDLHNWAVSDPKN